MSRGTDGEVTIAGRAFTLGAVYAPAAGVRFPSEQRRLLPLRLVSYDPAYPWPEGRVEAEYVPSADNPRTPRRRMSGLGACAGAGLPMRYLRERRGISRWDPDRLRWHPACPWDDGGAGCASWRRST